MLKVIGVFIRDCYVNAGQEKKSKRKEKMGQLGRLQCTPAMLISFKKYVFRLKLPGFFKGKMSLKKCEQ